MDHVDTAKKGGTGNKLTTAVITVCGVAALVASLITFLSIWLQSKNYRKPLLQRYVIRILLMVPIYSASSWGSLMSLTAALYLDPLRDIYEAFTIYTFLQLLINFLGGERSLIIMMHGRRPKSHAWPLNHCLPMVDISDPYTFLTIKRGILQYAWLKPILAIATIIMKATGVYHEGALSVDSGYLWVGIFYNLSVTISLYSLAMFWICMSEDLKPFRPIPKFLCVKLIIFASYWQGFFLSILQFLGAIPSGVEGYQSSDNLAAAIQDALICFEMPIFAVSHWYAFSWHDYADVTISAARMPVKFALRDAFGLRDLIEDTKETFGGKQYEYRTFDTGDNILAHEESGSRTARIRAGMRYSRHGKGKYWIPKPGEAASVRTPLLHGQQSQNPGNGTNSPTGSHGTTDSDELDGALVDPEDERLFESARTLEFGDWNYPVITAHIPLSDRWLQDGPNLLTTSTNRKLLHPTKISRERRESRIENHLSKGKSRDSSSSNSPAPSSRSKDRRGSGSTSGGREHSTRTHDKGHMRAPVVASLIREESTSSKSAKSGRSQLVDLVVEDTEAEEQERVRARKEGGPAWNKDEPRHLVRTYGDEDQGEDIREGFEPDDVQPDFSRSGKNDGNDGAAKGQDESEGEDKDKNQGEDSTRGQKRDQQKPAHGYGDMDDRNVWG